MFVNGASILHADLDAFFASVEQRDDPRLRGRAVIVGAGVVLAASYEAKARGVETAMGGRRARHLCPDAVVVPPRFSAYSEASKAVFRVFDDITPAVEGLSIDEAFLDVRGFERSAGTPYELAVRLRREVRRRVGLPITVGVARTKFLAKVASGVAKQVALLPERVLCSLVGRASGRHLHALAHNLDPRPVQTGRRRGSIGSQRARGRRPVTPEDVDADLVALVDRVTRRLRAADRIGRTVVLRLRFDDFARATRSHTLPLPASGTRVILAVARALLASAWPLIEERGLTLVGIAVANLESASGLQPQLPFDGLDDAALDATVDDIRRRFGSDSLVRGVLVGRRTGWTPPLLPD